MKVTEHFVGRQGEGINSGIKFIFLRLHGCRMECPFCDTTNSKGDRSYLQMDIAQIVVKLYDLSKANNDLKRVIITGGEPTEQYAELNDLCRELVNRKFELFLETNGTGKGVNYSFFKHVTISPKDRIVCFEKISKAEIIEMKYLHDPADPINSISFAQGMQQEAEQKLGYFPPATIQPMDCRGGDVAHLLFQMKEIQNIPEYTDFRVLPQLHKLIQTR